MSTQYDNIGKRYASMDALPVKAIEKPSVLNVLGDVRGLKCLDLACGLGRWSRILVEEGATHVTGVDISEGMIQSAREKLNELPDDDAAKIVYHAEDCSKPLHIDGGPFDLVLAVWFLNYASCYEDMLTMWRNVHDNLKPGGRFVALTSNTFCGLDIPIDDRYGIMEKPVHPTDDGGWASRIVAYTEPENIEFDDYHYSHVFYERAAAEAGMSGIKWRSHVIPNDGRPTGFWDVYNLRPHQSIVTAVKPK